MYLMYLYIIYMSLSIHDMKIYILPDLHLAIFQSQHHRLTVSPPWKRHRGSAGVWQRAVQILKGRSKGKKQRIPMLRKRGISMSRPRDCQKMPKSLFSPTHKPFREFCKHSTQVVVRPMLGIQNWYRSAWCENIASHLPTKFVFLGAVDESRMVFIDFLV